MVLSSLSSQLINVHKVGMPASVDLSILAVPEVYIHFGAEEVDTRYKYLFQPKVLYYDEQLDVALLQLQEKTAEGDILYFPPALNKFIKLNDIKDILFLGHGHPDHQKYKVVDMRCEVITDSSPKLIATKNWFQSTGQKFVIDRLNTSGQMINPDELKSPYAMVADQRNLVVVSYIRHGGAGSPMINSGSNVVCLYTCGIPTFYWTVFSDKDRDDFKERAFGCEVTFNAIYHSMTNYIKQGVKVLLDENMIKDIFSIDKIH